MFERFTEAARQVIVLAQDEARALGHGHIGTEHLLLGLLREAGGLGGQVLAGCGVTIDGARRAVIELVGSDGRRTEGQIPFTAHGKEALETALREALALGHNYIETEHLLLALCRVQDGTAARVLRDSGADAARIRAEVTGLVESPERRAKAAGGRPPAGIAARAAARMVGSRSQSGPSPDLRQLLLGAATCAREDGRDQPRFDDILIALTRAPGAATLLGKLGIDEASVRRAAGREPTDKRPPPP